MLTNRLATNTPTPMVSTVSSAADAWGVPTSRAAG